MLVTEAVAASKWCPYSGSPPVGRARGADGTLAAGTTCIASGCMAWRWSKTPDDGVGYCGVFASVTTQGFK